MITKKDVDTYLEQYNKIGEASMEALSWYHKNVKYVTNFDYFKFVDADENYIEFEGNTNRPQYETYYFSLETKILYDEEYRKRLIEEENVKKVKIKEEKRKKQKLEKEEQKQQRFELYKELKNEFEK